MVIFTLKRWSPLIVVCGPIFSHNGNTIINDNNKIFFETIVIIKIGKFDTDA